jgi:broad-specificity NMP kinase
MSIIFLTGLSGTGKTSTIKNLKQKGFMAYDLDDGYTILNEDHEMVIDEAKLHFMISKSEGEDVFLSACYSNQGKFYQDFKHVVLLKASLSEMKKRILSRTENHYGKSDEEWVKIETEYHEVLPLLHHGATHIIDTNEISIENIALECINLLDK